MLLLRMDNVSLRWRYPPGAKLGTEDDVSGHLRPRSDPLRSLDPKRRWSSFVVILAVLGLPRLILPLLFL